MSSPLQFSVAGPSRSNNSSLSNALQPLRQSVSSIANTANIAIGNGTPSSRATASFRAPAHKHAHHLHSIPPREKSTRTLIVDHMLWVHARTRFAQARCELGMTDRTGGKTSPHYAHRERPENYDEEDEAHSDGEDASQLQARESVPETSIADRVDHRQDLPLAKTLRLRAEGVEKVITSMLDQPPPVHPIHEDDIFTPPTSPKLPAKLQHKLPNGVRLRLALGTMINDIFARQAPSHVSPPPKTNSVPSPLPPALSLLSHVASSSATISQHSFRPQPNDRTSRLYAAGVDFQTANSLPEFRCPRHLHTGCEICVVAQPSGRISTKDTSARIPYQRGSGGITGYQDECGVGSGLSMPGPSGSVLRRKLTVQNTASPADGTGSTRLSDLIPRFLRISALVASELGSEVKDEERELNGGPDSSEDGGSQIGRNYSTTLQPTREWYLLLAGLLTRAVLEGYLTAGWRGLQPVQCLMSVGKSCANADVVDLEDIDEFEDFDPDEMPSLLDAIKILFPALREGTRKGLAEAEYEMEMEQRLKKFYDIPESTPDLSTHMEDLAWLYPAEPVERAAVRYCESLAKWRGKPELETYKSRPITIESLVHTSPQGQNIAKSRPGLNKRRPPIEKYFCRPPTWGTKRPRSPIPDQAYPPPKRLHL